jgi:hypothetical protein
VSTRQHVDLHSVSRATCAARRQFVGRSRSSKVETGASLPQLGDRELQAQLKMQQAELGGSEAEPRQARRQHERTEPCAPATSHRSAHRRQAVLRIRVPALSRDEFAAERPLPSRIANRSLVPCCRGDWSARVCVHRNPHSTASRLFEARENSREDRRKFRRFAASGPCDLEAETQGCGPDISEEARCSPRPSEAVPVRGDQDVVSVLGQRPSHTRACDQGADSTGARKRA